MGISCDFEAGSMESEIKPTCNKEFIKINGQHSSNDLDETTVNVGAVAIAKPSEAQVEVITIDDHKTTDTAVNIASPISQEVCLNLFHNKNTRLLKK